MEKMRQKKTVSFFQKHGFLSPVREPIVVVVAAVVAVAAAAAVAAWERFPDNFLPSVTASINHQIWPNFLPRGYQHISRGGSGSNGNNSSSSSFCEFRIRTKWVQLKLAKGTFQIVLSTRRKT